MAATAIETIRRVTIQARADGATEAEAALNRVRVATKDLSATNEQASKNMASNAAEVTRARRSFEELYAATEKLTRLQKALTIGVAAGRVDQETANRIYERAADTYTGLSKAIALAAREQEKLQASNSLAAREAIKAADAQEALNRATARSSQANIGTNLGFRAAPDIEQRGADFAAAAAAADNLRAKYEPLFSAQKNLSAGLAEINQAERAGVIAADVATAARERQTMAYEKAAYAIGEAARATARASQNNLRDNLGFREAPDAAWRESDFIAAAAAADRLRAEYDGLFSAALTYREGLERVNAAERAGIITADVATAARDRQTLAYRRSIHELGEAERATARNSQNNLRDNLGFRAAPGIEQRGADMMAAIEGQDRLRAKYDQTFAAEQKLAASTAEINQLLASGGFGAEGAADRAAKAIERETKAYRDQIDAINGVVKAAEPLSMSQKWANLRGAAPAPQGQTAGQASAALGSLSSTGLPQASASAQRLRNELVPLAAAQDALAQTTAKANAALASGLISAPEREAAIARSTATFHNQRIEIEKADQANARAAKGAGLNAYAWTNLSYQVNDVVTSLASGISPMQTLAQQGGQVFQILQSDQGGVKGGLKSVRDMLLGLVTPARLAFGGIVAGAATATYALYSYQSQQAELRRQTNGIGAASGATAGSINAMAPDAARAAGVSTSAAREMAGSFAATGKIGQEMYSGLIQQTRAYALVTGTDATEATKLFADAFADPAKGSLDLNKNLGFLDATMARNIKNLDESGDRLGAQKLLMQGVSAATGEASNKLGFFAKQWEDFKNTTSNEIDAIGGFISKGLGMEDPEARLKTLQGQLSFRKTNFFGSIFEFDSKGIEAEIKKVQDEVDKRAAAGRSTAARRNSLEIGAITAQLEPAATAFEASNSKMEKLRRAISDPIKFGLSLSQLAETQNAFDRLSATTRSMREDMEKYGDASLAAASRSSALQNKLSTDRANPVDRQIAERTATTQEELRRRGLDQLPPTADVMAGFNTKLADPNLDARELQTIAQAREAASRLTTERDALARQLSTDVDTIKKETDIRATRSQSISGYMDRVIGAESGGDPYAKNTRSTATGLGQFTEGTWRGLFKERFPDRAATMTDPQILARRTDRDDSVELIRTFTEQNARALEKAGFATNDRNLYLSHLAGSQGALDLLRSDRSASAVSVLGDRAARANPTIMGPGKTAGDVIDYAERTINKSAPAIRTTDRETASLRAQTVLTDQTAEAQARLQKIQELLNGETERGTALGRSFSTAQELVSAAASKLTPEMEAQRKVILETAMAYGKAQAGLENSKIGRDAIFERSQIGRTSSEAAIASRLRGTGLGMESAEASALRLNDNLRETKELSRDAFSGIATDLSHGVSAMDALASAFTRFADKLISTAADKAITGLFGGLTGGSNSDGSGFLGTIATLFGGGSPIPKFAKGGIMTGPSIAGEAGPEAAVPLPDGRNIPVVLSQPANSNSRGGLNVQVNNTVSDRAEAQVTEGPDGTLMIDILDKGLAKKQAAGRSEVGRAAQAGRRG